MAHLLTIHLLAEKGDIGEKYSIYVEKIRVGSDRNHELSVACGVNRGDFPPGIIKRMKSFRDVGRLYSHLKKIKVAGERFDIALDFIMRFAEINGFPLLAKSLGDLAGMTSGKSRPDADRVGREPGENELSVMVSLEKLSGTRYLLGLVTTVYWTLVPFAAIIFAGHLFLRDMPLVFYLYAFFFIMPSVLAAMVLSSMCLSFFFNKACSSTRECCKWLFFCTQFVPAVVVIAFCPHASVGSCIVQAICVNYLGLAVITAYFFFPIALRYRSFKITFLYAMAFLVPCTFFASHFILGESVQAWRLDPAWICGTAACLCVQLLAFFIGADYAVFHKYAESLNTMFEGGI